MDIKYVSKKNNSSDNKKPVVENMPAEDQEVSPGQSIQRPQQTLLMTKDERHDAQPAATLSAAQDSQKDTARGEDNAQTRLSRPMSHLSATVPPLNLGQHHRGTSRGFYTFQTPASPRPDPRGGPGILVQAPVKLDSRPSMIASSKSPALLNNPQPRIRAALQAEGLPRTSGHPPLSRSDPPPHNTQNRKAPPRTPPPRTALATSQRAQQSAPKIGSPLRQSHQYIPYSPRDVGSPSAAYRPLRPQGPRPSDQLARSATIGDIVRPTNADVGSAANPQETNRTTLGQQHNEEAQNTVDDPHTSNFETHVVRLRESDLAGLIASGVIKVNPESHPPEWMLKYAPRFSSHKPGVEILNNAERRTVKLRHSEDSIQRNRSHRAEVESVGRDGATVKRNRRYRSNDSGYCTASSSGILSNSTLGKTARKQQYELKMQYKPPALPLSWSQASSAPSSQDEVTSRTLRRRSSVPELSSRFRVEREIHEHEADEQQEEKKEEEEASLRDEYVREERAPMARVGKTNRAFDISPVDSISLSE